MDSIIVLLFLLWSAQLDGKRQSGPDPEQSGEIDGQKGPSPGGKPCGKVGRGKEAGESARTAVDTMVKGTVRGLHPSPAATESPSLFNGIRRTMIVLTGNAIRNP